MNSLLSFTLPRGIRRLTAAGAALSSVFLLTPAAFGIGDEIAVAGRVFNGYTRTRLPDKSYQAETYSFAEGGRLDAAIAGDPIDQVPFLTIARMLVRPLASQGYVQSANPKQTQLMIMVFWGTTRGTEDKSNSPAYERVQEAMSANNASLVTARADLIGGNNEQQGAANAALTSAAQSMSSAMTSLAMEQDMRDRTDRTNSGILGFQTELWRAYATEISGSTQDFLTELRSNRYFVVLKAYDFQQAYLHKRRKILWESRFSIRERGVVFSEQLPAMAAFASQYFGKELNNLIRRPLPEGKIELGETKFMSFEPATATPAQRKAKP